MQDIPPQLLLATHTRVPLLQGASGLVMYIAGAHFLGRNGRLCRPAFLGSMQYRLPQSRRGGRSPGIHVLWQRVGHLHSTAGATTHLGNSGSDPNQFLRILHLSRWQGLPRSLWCSGHKLRVLSAHISKYIVWVGTSTGSSALATRPTEKGFLCWTACHWHLE